MAGKLGYPLHDHALTGKLAGKRAFSMAGDIRIIYIELEDSIVFLDIGTHNQVYWFESSYHFRSTSGSIIFMDPL